MNQFKTRLAQFAFNFRVLLELKAQNGKVYVLSVKAEHCVAKGNTLGVWS